MDVSEYARKLAELEQLFNDDGAPLQPQKLWSLLAELTWHHLAQAEPRRGAMRG